MKKTIIAMSALALVAQAVSAADVYSSNIVGYQKLTLNNAWTIIGLNFEGVSGGTISIQDALPYAAGMTLGSSITVADTLQIQNAGGGYDTYYISNGLNAKGSPVAGLANKWALAGTYVPTTNRISSGTGMWYGAKNPSPTLVATTPGQVLLAATGTMPVSLAAKHIANPYATDLPLNDGVPFTVGMTVGSSITVADTIQIQNAGGGYDTYYISNGLNAKGSPVAGLANKWAAAGTYVPTTNSLPAGKGAWYVRKGVSNFDITVARPFSLP